MLTSQISALGALLQPLVSRPRTVESIIYIGDAFHHRRSVGLMNRDDHRHAKRKN